MKPVLAAIGVLMIIIAVMVTGRAYGWFGDASQDSLQAVGGPLIGGLGLALLWTIIMRRT